MAPEPTNVDTVDDQWLAFRKKHDDEKKIFWQNVTSSHARLHHKAKSKETEILARHKREEEEFWSKAKATANKGKRKTGNRSSVSKIGAQSQANRRVTAAPPEATARVKQTPAPSSNTPPTPKPGSNTAIPAAGSKNKQAAVTIIDLCSDEDDDVPVLSWEKPALRLADSNAQEPDTTQSSQFKVKHSVGIQKSPAPHTTSPTLLTNGIGNPNARISTPATSQRTSTATPQTQQYVSYRRDQPSPAQESSFRGLPLDKDDVMQREGRVYVLNGSIVTMLDGSKSNSAAQLVTNGTTKNVHIDQVSHSSVQARNAMVESIDGDSLMREAPHASTRPQQPTPNMLPSTSAVLDAHHTPSSYPDIHAPTSPSSGTPITQPPTLATPTTASFRRPFLPASVAKDSITAARNVRASSQASASTYRSSSIFQSQRDTSVASRTSFSSSHSSKGKRKVVDLSSDEENDYSPPSDDDEPRSSVMTDKAPRDVKKKQVFGPASKKAKLPPTLPPALTSKSIFKREKNGFGFTNLQKPKPNVNSQTASSLPSTPPRAPIKSSQPTSSSTPTPPSKRPTRPTSAISPVQAAPVSRSPRKAKLDASARISQLSEAELQTRTDMTIDEAKKHKETEARFVEQVRGSLTGMSITPAPSTASDNAVEDVQTLANISDPESATSRTPTCAKHSAGWNSWTRSRVNGDRYLAKSRSSRPIVRDDEDDEDPDVSKYSVINGIILHEADLDMARLTGEQDRRNLTISRETDGGSHARAVSAVEVLEHKASVRGKGSTRKTYGKKGVEFIRSP